MILRGSLSIWLCPVGLTEGKQPVAWSHPAQDPWVPGVQAWHLWDTLCTCSLTVCKRWDILFSFAAFLLFGCSRVFPEQNTKLQCPKPHADHGLRKDDWRVMPQIWRILLVKGLKELFKAWPNPLPGSKQHWFEGVPKRLLFSSCDLKRKILGNVGNRSL